MNFGTRVLIILYALALVVLGLQPLQREYGGVRAYIDELSKEIVGKELSLPKLSIPKQVRFELGDSEAKGKRKELSSGGSTKSANHKEVQAFDSLEKQDRRELNSLLERVGN